MEDTELTEDFETDHEEVEQEEVEHYPTLDEIAQENGFISWGASYEY